MNDHRKASYAAALELWRQGPNKDYTLCKPGFQNYGLSYVEAQKVEKEGYDTSILPTPLRPQK